MSLLCNQMSRLVQGSLGSQQKLTLTFYQTKRGAAGYKKIEQPKVAVVSGASRGIGYATAKVLANKLKTGHIYLTTRGDPAPLTELMREQVKNRQIVDNIEFHTVDVTQIDSIVQFRNMIHAKHGQIDILVNNAGKYFAPDEDPLEHFRQVEKTMMTNYWGTKSMCKAFIPMLSSHARVVNLSSHLGHLSLIPGQLIRERLASPSLTEHGLDGLVMEYQEHCAAHMDDFDDHGWPSCAYSVSKVAVNAYTSILQHWFDNNNMTDVVVNSIHPGSYHSKISQESPLTADDAAKAVVTCALLATPCSHPRGRFIWHDLQIMDWTQGSLKGMRV